LLCQDFAIASEIYSVTSFSELARDARAVERHNRLHPEASAKTSHIGACLSGVEPIIAATDYVRAYPELIAAHVEAPFLALGTDGFGRSDTRHQLRAFFEVSRHHIAIAAIAELVRSQRIDKSILTSAIARYRIHPDRREPWTV
jgi:pyruvate dehydrogenase E1 component